MTGPEHYREAERLLSDGCMQLLQNKAMVESAIAEAQVHATLALAAATALGYDHVPTLDYQMWIAAAATPQEVAP